MDICVTKKLNATTQLTIKFDGERDIKEALLKATPFMQLRGTCGLCGKDNTEFRARQTPDGKYIYIEQACLDCGAQQTFGEYKAPKGAFYLKKWQKYVPKPQEKKG